MSYNKYNNRNSGRFNTPGQFVPANEGNFTNDMGPPRTLQPVQYKQPQMQQPNQGYSTFQAPPLTVPPTLPAPPEPEMEMEMKAETNVDSQDAVARPPWMKSKLQGVKKISNKERRRRQNENLRRLLSPKSALMVLNEIMPGEQVANQFRVDTVGAGAGNQYYRANQQAFCADLTLKGNNYKGYGENKLTARNAAAEQAVRDLILRRMTRALMADSSGAAEGTEGSPNGEGEDDTLPMIQLASFALHKLFAEWEYEGHKVPQLRTPNPSVSEAVSEADSIVVPSKPKAPKKKELPENAASMHPCMLLTYMRPQLEYRELATEGDRPQNMLFTMGIDVDGATYIGKATNKKEARKAAAKAACVALFNVNFDAAN